MAVRFFQRRCLLCLDFLESGRTVFWLPVVPHGGMTACVRYEFSRGGVLEILGFLQVAVRPQLIERYDRNAVIPGFSWR